MMLEDDSDAEWEDFNRLMTEYNLRKRKVLASPVFQRRHVDDLQESRFDGTDNRPQTAFYPCPPSAGINDEVLPFAETAVSVHLRVLKSSIE